MTSGKGRTGGGWATAFTALLAAILFPACAAYAASSVTPGYTCSVASQGGLPLVGTHFHSDHAGAFGNPPDKAEVGSLQSQGGDEECRGLSEFNLTGLAPGTATLNFYVYQTGGLFPGMSGNPSPFSGNIAVVGYTGNNADDVADYHVAPLASLGTFPTAGLTAGTLISFNATSFYNSQLSGGSPALGIRLQTTPSTVTGGGAFTFDNFTLTVTSIPEPTALTLLSAATCLALMRRRRAATPMSPLLHFMKPQPVFRSYNGADRHP